MTTAIRRKSRKEGRGCKGKTGKFGILSDSGSFDKRFMISHLPHQSGSPSASTFSWIKEIWKIFKKKCFKWIGMELDGMSNLQCGGSTTFFISSLLVFWCSAFKQDFQFIFSSFSFFWVLIFLKYMRNSVVKSEMFTLTKSVIFSFISSLNKGSFSSLEGKIQKIILSWKMVFCGTCEGDAEDDKVHQDEAKMLVHLKKSLIKPVKLCTLDTFLSFSKCCFSTSTLTTT